MKQTLLLLFAILLTAISSNAQTASGTVQDACGNPVVGQKVYILDTAASPHYFDSALTTAGGAYTFTLPASVYVGDFLRLYAPACGTYYYGGGTASATTATMSTITTCTSGPGYGFSGTIHLPGSTSTNRDAKVYVIRKYIDTNATGGIDTMLAAVDSISVSGTSTFSKSYSSQPSFTIGWYFGLYVKVVLLPTDAEYSNYLPTYVDSALQWNNASVISSSAFGPCNLSNFQVYMYHGTNPGGPGFIGGNVLLGANKATAAGDPLAKRIIILTKSDNTPVAYTYSDVSGHFQFPSVPYGSYKLFGDVWGKKNPALNVTVSASGATVNNIVFKENKHDFTGQIGGLSVNGANPVLAGITAYPNPAKDFVEIGGLSAIDGSKTATLTSINGAVLAHVTVSAASTLRVPMASLPSGMYLLRIDTEAGSVQMKVTK